MNPHDGAVLLEHAGRTATLRFSWGAIEEIRAEWGDEYVKRMDAAMSAPILPDVAWLVAKTCGISQAEVMEWSPPIGAANAALSKAWQQAWFGAGDPVKADAENPQTALTLLQRLSGLLWRPASAPASAGTSSGV